MRTWIIRLWACVAVFTSVGLAPLCQASEARQTPIVKAVERAKRAVVNIYSERTARDQDIFEGGRGRKINGMGTGVIIDERGYIATNQHVVAEVDSLRVALFDGSTYAASVISYDRPHDVAIIKINSSKKLPVAPIGTSSDLMLGETVIAVGNPFGYEHTITVGVVSSLSRDVEVNEQQSYKNLLQTDASINPGSSGGPLLNVEGEVVGINVAIRAGAQRIGFAIPIDDARKHIAKLLNIQKLNETYHGLVTHDVKNGEQRKLVVDAADPNSPAATAGFQPGDEVVQVGPTPVTDQADLERACLGRGVGEALEVVVKRGSESVKLSMQLSPAPGAKVAGAPAKPIARGQTPSVLVEEGPPSKSWEILGLRVERVAATQLPSNQKKYRGGMRVTDVRPDSPASKSNIRKGDILVGLHVWETVKPQDVIWVIDHPELKTFDPLKFYIVRDRDVLYGHLRIGSDVAHGEDRKLK
jgi:serine protease Do